MSSNTEKGRAGKGKKNDTFHLSDALTGAKNICMLQIPRHSYKEYKVLKDYLENHVARKPFKEKEFPYGSNKRAKTVKFDNATQEVNTMKSHDEKGKK